MEQLVVDWELSGELAQALVLPQGLVPAQQPEWRHARVAQPTHEV